MATKSENDLHYCAFERGSDNIVPLLASKFEAVFTRILCSWKNLIVPGRPAWVVLACRKNISFSCHNSQVLLLSKWEHHCQKYLKRTTIKIDSDNLCAPVIDRDTTVTRGMTRVMARLKEKHPEILSCHQLFKLTSLGYCRQYISFHQIPRDIY